MYLRPIPQSERYINPELWEQNQDGERRIPAEVIRREFRNINK